MAALTDAGRIRIAALINGEAVDDFSAANAYVGVGNGSTAFAAAQTDLQGTTKTRVAVDSVTRDGDVLTFTGTFGPTEANQVMAEVGVFDSASGGLMLARAVVDLGTKTGGTYVLSVPVDLTGA